jgi:hypothetical protein
MPKQLFSARGGAGAGMGTAGGGDHMVTIPRPPKRPGLTIRLTTIGVWNQGTSPSFAMLRNPSGATNWTAPASLYDQFKVIGIRMRVFNPKYTSIGSVIGSGTAATGTLGTSPRAIAMTYDNDSMTAPASFAVACGYTSSAVASYDGETGFGIKRLPTGMIEGSTLTGGSVATAEWCDCLYAANLAGCMTFYLDVAAQGTWSSTPSTFTPQVLCEWLVEFRYRNTA